MTSYDTLINGIAVNISYREDEVKRYVTVTDKLTGQEFSDSYPRSFEFSEIIDIVMNDAIKAGKM